MLNIIQILRLLALLLVAGSCSDKETAGPDIPADGFYEIPVTESITHAQPMTGIVFWNTSPHRNTEAIALEFSYMLFNDIVSDSGQYDWDPVEERLDAIASRKHQAIFRFRYVYPGYETSVPQYIKELGDYHETEGISEGQVTWFPDWTHPELKRFTLEFYSKFAERYDNDPRLAFIQVGFGLWAEYHIYDGPFILGQTFPSKDFQEEFFYHLQASFLKTPWSISIDAADDTYSPFKEKPWLKDIAFGLFDDSFMHAGHAGYNTSCWNFFDRSRYLEHPVGGEFSYYSQYDQQHVLDPEVGAHGKPYEYFTHEFHISYILGNDQPDYQTMERIMEASLASGYRYRIVSFKASDNASKVTITNTGVAPIYHDAYVAVNGIRAEQSLTALKPGDTLLFEFATGGKEPVLSIQCDRLVSGQAIQFEGNNTK